MRYLSLFTGAGGFEQGMPSDWECVGFSEIDKYASAVLRYRYPNVKNYGDITKILWKQVPDFDVLVGGSPCQDLSLAGKRGGLTAKRSGLFYEYIRCLEEKKPDYFIWENVKGTFSTQTFIDIEVIIPILSEEIVRGKLLWQNNLLPDESWDTFADNVRNYLCEILHQNSESQKKELGILSMKNSTSNSQDWKEERYIIDTMIQNSKYLLIQISQIIKKSNYSPIGLMEALEELEGKWDMCQNLSSSKESRYFKDINLLEETMNMLESIGLLWKENLEEPSSQMRLYTTLTLINLTTDMKICMFAQRLSINIFILRQIISSTYFWKEIRLNLKKERGMFYVKTINLIIDEFTKKGYKLWWQVLNAKDFGVPQNRERIFVIGFRNKSPKPIFFERKDEKTYFISEERPKPKAQFYTAITTKEGRRKENNFILIPSATKQGFEIAEEGDGLSLTHLGSRTGRGRVGDKQFQALTTQGSAYTIQNNKIRRLLPIECERLMSWKDDWTRWGMDEKGKKFEISDTQRYKMCGNGVVSNVVRELIDKMIA